MNECPTCGRKIRGETCPYCDEELGQDDAADSTPVSGEALMTVFSCDEEWRAEFVMSLLESEGIPAYIDSHDSPGGAAEDGPEASGDIVIRVEEEDSEKATEIITLHRHDIESSEH
jgi:hypothetical protein